MTYASKLYQILFASDGVCFSLCEVTFGSTKTHPWLKSTVHELLDSFPFFCFQRSEPFFLSPVKNHFPIYLIKKRSTLWKNSIPLSNLSTEMHKWWRARALTKRWASTWKLEASVKRFSQYRNSVRNPQHWCHQKPVGNPLLLVITIFENNTNLKSSDFNVSI